MAWLQNPTNAQSIGMKYAPRQRVNVSANQDRSAKNLLFSESGKSGALGRNAETGNIYYMANIRGRGKFPSFPLDCTTVGIQKVKQKSGQEVTVLHIVIDFPFANDGEIDLAKAWLNKTAQPTLEPAKPRNGQPAPVQTSVTTDEDETEESTPVQTTTITTTTTTSAPTNDFEKSLTLVQKTVRKKAIEIGLYPDEATANANFTDWKNTTVKELG